MSIFFIQKFKNKVKNNYIYSLFFPIFFLFPYLFSYIFFTPKSILSSDADINRINAVSLDEEISGIENTLQVDDFRQINENKQDNSTSSVDIVNTKSTIKIFILGYHQVRETKLTDGPKTRMFITKPEIFDKEMEFLSDKGYHTISIIDYVNYLKTGKANFNLNKSFILTFDDGYASQYVNAFPILKKYSFNATFFIYSDCIDRYPVCMTSEQLKDLTSNGMKIGNHTVHHLYLPKYSDDIIKNEIEVNEEKLISIVGTSSIENILAYPYGATDNRVEDIIKSFNYDGAVGVLATKKDKDNDIFNLRRYLLGEDYNFFESLFK